MGLKNIALIITGGRDVFYAGEVVSGLCQVEVADGSEVPCINVKFHGLAHVHWSETRSRGSGKHRTTYTVTYTSNVEFFCLEQNLSTTTGKIPSGMHQIPFSFQLPQGLPTSMEGAYGYIRYRLEAQAPANWFASLFKPKATRDVNVLQWIDTNLPQYRFAVAGSDTKTNCCCCCASGPLVVEASTDRAAYCPNDVVAITATFRNNSSKKVKPYAKLVQKRTFYAEGKQRITSNSWKLEPLVDDGAKITINEGGSASWNGIQFRLPDAVLPSINSGNIMVTYHVEVGLDIPWAFDLEVYLPVVIGTVPFRNEPVIMQMQPVGQPGPAIPGAPGWQPQADGTGAYPWVGSGKQSGTPIASAPPLASPTVETMDFSVPPPSYFAAVFANENPTLPQFEDNSNNANSGNAAQPVNMNPSAGAVAYIAPPPAGKQ